MSKKLFLKNPGILFKSNCLPLSVCDKTTLTKDRNQNGKGNTGNGTAGEPAAGPSEPAGNHGNQTDIMSPFT